MGKFVCCMQRLHYNMSCALNTRLQRARTHASLYRRYTYIIYYNTIPNSKFYFVVNPTKTTPPVRVSVPVRTDLCTRVYSGFLITKIEIAYRFLIYTYCITYMYIYFSFR